MDPEGGYSRGLSGALSTRDDSSICSVEAADVEGLEGKQQIFQQEIDDRPVEEDLCCAERGVEAEASKWCLSGRLRFKQVVELKPFVLRQFLGLRHPAATAPRVVDVSLRRFLDDSTGHSLKQRQQAITIRLLFSVSGFRLVVRPHQLRNGQQEPRRRDCESPYLWLRPSTRGRALHLHILHKLHILLLRNTTF